MALICNLLQQASHLDKLSFFAHLTRRFASRKLVKCEVKTTGEMEVVNGGSFALLAVVVVAIFVYVEREKLRKVF